MPCPWFCPTRPLEDGRWAVPPRVPLIEPWEGECHAGAEPVTPDNDTARTRCNSGYARGACDRFAEGRGDAVRFHVTASAPDRLQILYSYERDCWPSNHGVVEYDIASSHAECDDAILRKQAEAFALTYRKRTGASA
ncbi:MAG TPA: hypothetical protein VFA04_19495 [Bryobacteraceae bacterium]|jgi:hypothetical protein|nr:hypothetical protein [Bryobacteraceae bacterium]